MSWTARVVSTKNPDSYESACLTCKHEGPCNIPRVTDNLGPLLSGVDVGRDGYMSIGDAVLKCNAHEDKETVSESPATEDQAEGDSPA